MWVAVSGNGEVCRYDRFGLLVSVLQVDAPSTASVTFAGRRLDVLVITPADAGLTRSQVDAYPTAVSPRGVSTQNIVHRGYRRHR